MSRNAQTPPATIPILPISHNSFLEFAIYGEFMQRSIRCFALLFATAALAVPLATKTTAQEVIVREGDHTRYYDRDHKDYHQWNDREDRSYRVYLTGRHHEYHEFNHANQREQRDYWRWRHNHPDHD
jgi:hypothetical protein